MIASGSDSRPKTMLAVMTTGSRISTNTLTCGRTPRCSCQSRSIGPNSRERSSRSFSAGDERTKR
jgi:hypothetical protein